MKYSLVSGQLPHGISMDQSNGQLRLHGVTLPDLDFFSPPQISGDSNLGYVNEFEEAIFDVSVELPPERTLMGVTLVDGVLPWGFEFDGSTIRGTAAELLDKAAPYYAPEECPLWKTTGGALATLAEAEFVEIPLQVEGANTISVVSGNLPWGLEVTSNSVVGTTAELVAPSDPYINTQGPVWQTQAGMIGVFDEDQPVQLTVRAHPRVEGGEVNIYLTKGYLPYGLELQPSSGEMEGVIFGVVDELRGLVTQHGPFNSPRLDTRGLPAMAVGQAVEGTMAATAFGGKSFGFEATGLPWGVVLSPSGELHGTPIAAGVYNATITVRDRDYLTASKTFSITVTE